MRDAGELRNNRWRADLQGVEFGEDVAADGILGVVVPCKVTFVVDDVFVRWGDHVGCDDEVAPAETEEVEQGL